MDKLHTHYDNLKVTRNAPVEVIRAAYRAMAQKYHPDINSSFGATNTMRLLNEAWEVLSDPIKRAQHDMWIAAEEAKQRTQSPPNTAHSNEQVFKNENFEFHFHKPTKGGENFRKNQRNRHHYDEYVARKQYSSSLTVLNAWLGRRDIKIKAISVVAIFLLGGFLWLSIESHRAKKAIDELHASTPVLPSEKSSDWQVVEERPLIFTPLPEVPEKGFKKKEKVPDSVNSETLTQRESTKVIDPAKQDRSGYVKGAYQQASAGLSKFTVDNERGGADAIARIYLNGKKPPSRSMYIKAGETFTAFGLPPGSYIFRYRFIGSTKTYQADSVFPLEETSTAEGTRFSNVTVTLFKVSNGNLQTKEVPEEEF